MISTRQLTGKGLVGSFIVANSPGQVQDAVDRPCRSFTALARVLHCQHLQLYVSDNFYSWASLYQHHSKDVLDDIC